jgi:hypothetical protein
LIEKLDGMKWNSLIFASDERDEAKCTVKKVVDIKVNLIVSQYALLDDFYFPSSHQMVGEYHLQALKVCLGVPAYFCLIVIY